MSLQKHYNHVVLLFGILVCMHKDGFFWTERDLRGGNRRWRRSGKLALDRSLIDDRPDPADFSVFEFVEHMLAELNAPAIDRKVHEGGFGGAIEWKPGGNARRVADRDLCLKSQVGNVDKVLDQHVAIARQPDWPAIVFDIVVDEGAEVIEGLVVEAVEVSEIDGVECLQVVLLHRYGVCCR